MCQNIYYILQFGVVKDIFSRAILEPHSSMEKMESALYSHANSEAFLKFHIGSTHHIAAFIMWILDFSGFLVRFLHIYFKKSAENSNNSNNSHWIFFLIPSCRRNILELLIMVEQFFRIFKPVEKGVNGHAKGLVYLKQLENMISDNRVQHAQMLLFWKHICESLDQLKVPDQDTFVENLIATGIVSDTATALINSVKSLFEKYIVNLYKLGSISVIKDAKEVAILTAFAQPNRFQLNTNIDNILKLNIKDQKKKLLECNRCSLTTQTVMELDSGIQDDFQTMPPWLNAFQDQCFCGGSWIPK
jgi:hypothetical protein